MPAPSRRERDAERRETVERYHRLKDVEEDYGRAMSSAMSSDDRQTLMDNVAAYRQRHREKDVERGKQPRGGGVVMEQIMWARWAEVMIDHELAAREAYTAIVDGRHRSPDRRTAPITCRDHGGCLHSGGPVRGHPVFDP